MGVTNENCEPTNRKDEDLKAAIAELTAVLKPLVPAVVALTERLAGVEAAVERLESVAETAALAPKGNAAPVEMERVVSCRSPAPVARFSPPGRALAETPSDVTEAGRRRGVATNASRFVTPDQRTTSHTERDADSPSHFPVRRATPTPAASGTPPGVAGSGSTPPTARLSSSEPGRSPVTLASPPGTALVPAGGSPEEAVIPRSTVEACVRWCGLVAKLLQVQLLGEVSAQPRAGGRHSIAGHLPARVRAAVLRPVPAPAPPEPVAVQLHTPPVVRTSSANPRSPACAPRLARTGSQTMVVSPAGRLSPAPVRSPAPVLRVDGRPSVRYGSPR